MSEDLKPTYQDDEIDLRELFVSMWKKRYVTILVALLGMFIGGAAFLIKGASVPVDSYSMDVRLTFKGAASGEYPNGSAYRINEEIGARLKQARLNRDLTQSEVATLAGIARKTVLNAEKGKVQLEILIAILMALDLTEQLDIFLPKQDISPLQLAKLQSKKRQRASGLRSNKDKETLEW